MSMINDPAHLRIELLSQPRFLAGVRATINAVSERLGFDHLMSSQIALAVDEAVCNVIRHGYGCAEDGRIWISVWALDAPSPGMCIVIEDEAKQVDPQAIKSRPLDEIRPGGLGVHIIHNIMDQVEFTKRQQGGMRLEMIKRLNSTKNSGGGSNADSESSSSSISKKCD